MRGLPRSAIAALFSWTATASAQTFIVDANNGPGTNFTDLPTAVAAVPDGAVLDVRPGSYAPFAIVSKGLSVIFEAGAYVRLLTYSSTPVSVSGTSALQTVVLRGLQIVDGTWFSSNRQPVLLTNCAGLLLLEDCGTDNRSIVVTNCNQVEAARCTVGVPIPAISTPGADLSHSNVVLRSCNVYSGGPYGVLVNSSQLQCVDTSIGVYQGYPSGPAILLQGGDARLIGGSSYVVAGVNITGTGTARIDPSVVFRGYFGGPIASTVQATFLTMPAVIATDGPLGGNVTVDLRGPAGDFGALLGGFPGPPLSFPGIADPSWMLPGTEVVCATTIFATGTSLSITVPVPNVAALRGLRVVWQGASFGTTNGLQASNPAVTTSW